MKDNRNFKINDIVVNAWGTKGIVVNMVDNENLDVIWFNKETSVYCRDLWHINADCVRNITNVG